METIFGFTGVALFAIAWHWLFGFNWKQALFLAVLASGLFCSLFALLCKMSEIRDDIRR